MIDVKKMRGRIEKKADQGGTIIAMGIGEVAELLDRLEAAEVENAAMDQERSRYRLEAMKLAAHVKRIKQIANDEEAPSSIGSEALFEAVADAPETSLAHMIAEKQAEALEEAKRNLPGGRSAAWHALGKMVDELRRQASEPSP